MSHNTGKSNTLRQLLERHTWPRALPLKLVTEVDSVQTMLSPLARGAADTVLSFGTTRAWNYPQAPNVATIHNPATRNQLVLAIPTAGPATHLSRYATEALHELVAQHIGTASLNTEALGGVSAGFEHN
ncbi:MAG: hypothetical protein K2X75_08420 [Burkholderiaceae bacterium]|jgi:LysR family nitrogen assimilation transcriptional regulator|nr:hypothetical protein [Burkholderiaceae bacterium]